jgi:hypothetical protein
MGVIDLVWYLNVNDSTKYILFVGFFVFIMLFCLYNGKKKKRSKKKRSQCQKNYSSCMRKNKMNGVNNFCYPCLDNGQSADFFYDPNIGQLRTPFNSL